MGLVHRHAIANQLNKAERAICIERECLVEKQKVHWQLVSACCLGDGLFKPEPDNELLPVDRCGKIEPDFIAVFQGAGNSHFTYADNQYHVTTDIPGLGQGVPIIDHFDLGNG